jgi:hypothetical protein
MKTNTLLSRCPRSVSECERSETRDSKLQDDFLRGSVHPVRGHCVSELPCFSTGNRSEHHGYSFANIERTIETATITARETSDREKRFCARLCGSYCEQQASWRARGDTHNF